MRSKDKTTGRCSHFDIAFAIPRTDVANHSDRDSMGASEVTLRSAE